LNLVLSLVVSVLVNGERFDAPKGASIASLLVTLGLHEQRVAVELNERVVPRRQHAETSLNEGDKLEIVTLVGGG
jgi:sulfur carrier protein